jgi:hypothetical protein
MEEKQYYKEKRISSSSLKYFEQSPLTFKKFLDQELEQEEKRYLEKGKQIHMAILEPDEFTKNYTTVKFDVPKSEQQKQFCEEYIDFLKQNLTEDQALTIAYRNNYKTASKSDIKQLEEAISLRNKLQGYIEYLQKKGQYKDIISWPDWQRISDLKKEVKTHKLAKDLLYEDDLSNRNVYSEMVIFWDDPIHNLPCKSMIDRLIVDHDNKKVILVDIKTCNTFKGFKERCREFGYFLQMTFYWQAIYWWFKNALNKDISGYNKETYIVALKTVDDAEAKVFSIDEIYLTEGLVEVQDKMSQIAWHWENDKWDHSRAYYIGDGYDKL